MGKVFGIVVVVAILGVIAYFAFPGVRAAIDQQIDRSTGWNDEARRNDPVGFIDYSIAKLDENVVRFEEARRGMAVSRAQLEEKRKENQGRVAFADRQLDAFKAAFQAAEGGKGWPQPIAGKSYGEDELKRQVAQLLSERETFQSLVGQVEKSLAQIDQRQIELVNRITKSKAARDQLTAQREIIKVNKLTSDTEQMLDQAHDVLVANEALAEKPAVRTLDEMMKDEAREAPPASDPKVDAFLTQ